MDIITSLIQFNTLIFTTQWYLPYLSSSSLLTLSRFQYLIWSPLKSHWVQVLKGKPTENTIIKQCNLPDLLSKHTTLYYTMQLKILGHSMTYNFMEPNINIGSPTIKYLNISSYHIDAQNALSINIIIPMT